MVDVIAHGESGEIYGPKGGERVNISHGGHTAVLSLYRYGNRQTWLLTGWENYKEASSASNGGNGPLGATRPDPMRTRPRAAETSINSNIPQKENLFNGKGWANAIKKLKDTNDGNIPIEPRFNEKPKGRKNSSLEEVEKELGGKVNQAIDPVTPPVGMSVHRLGSFSYFLSD